MEEKNLICICCPLGCPLTVALENGEVVSVTGNTCPRGAAYGRREVTNPTYSAGFRRRPACRFR